MCMVAASHLAERFPGSDRHLAVGLRREIENDLRCINVGLDARPSIGRTATIDAIVQLAQALYLELSVPRDAFTAVAELLGKRADRGETAISVGIVSFHNSDLRSRDAWHEIALPFFPILDLEGLRKLACSVVLD